MPSTSGWIAVISAQRGDEQGFLRSRRRVGGVAVWVMSAISFRRVSISSVMSIPTGHQVMQRPQPTHPSTSNCSFQVPSLCVSHWRYRERTVGRVLPPAW